MTRTRYWFVTTLILSLLLVSGSVAAYWYEDFSDAPVLDVFELSPSTIELVMRPDATETVKLRFRNMTARGYRFRITTTSFEGTNDGRRSWRPRPEPSWLRPTIKKFKLKRNNALHFSTRVISPHDAPAGGHYELLFVSNVLTTKKGSKREVKGISRLGAIFYITVPTGKTHSRTRLTRFTTNQRFYDSGPVDFITELYNKGNVHSRLQGNITVRNRLTGSRVGEVKIGKIIVLPNATKESVYRLPIARSTGLFAAKLSLKDTRSGKIITGETFFYGLSLQLALWVFLSGAVLLGTWSKLRRYRLVNISDLPKNKG